MKSLIPWAVALNLMLIPAVYFWDCDSCATWKAMMVQLILGSTITIMIFIKQYDVIQASKTYDNRQKNRERNKILPILEQLVLITKFYLKINDKKMPTLSIERTINQNNLQFEGKKTLDDLKQIREDVSEYVAHPSSNMDIDDLNELDRVLEHVDIAISSVNGDDREFMERVREIKDISDNLTRKFRITLELIHK